MTDQPASEQHSARTRVSRWILLIIAALFTLGAFGQFFLVGLSFFDDATRWKDHETLGHIVGLLPWVMWIPAVLGKTGRLIGGTLLLFVLFEAQYAFINVESTVAQAFHPLNGSVLLVFGFWITTRSLTLVRESSSESRRSPATMESVVMPDKLEGAIHE